MANTDTSVNILHKGLTIVMVIRGCLRFCVNGVGG